jgi:hypothetical protein
MIPPIGPSMRMMVRRPARLVEFTSQKNLVVAGALPHFFAASARASKTSITASCLNVRFAASMK